MLLVDAQVHIWSGGKPPTSANSGGSHRQVDAFSRDALLAEMDAAGIDAALLHPPTSWDPNANALAEAAAEVHPGRLAILGHFALDAPNAKETLTTWKQRPGQLGLRFTFAQPNTRAWLTDGTVDWLWPAAEQAGVPIAMTGAHVAMLTALAPRYPNLKFIVDHFGMRLGNNDDATRQSLEALKRLARLPNVALKATGAPAYARDAYPYKSIHSHMQQLYEAFGPQRYFWGTDITRMPCSYAECVSLFTEELPWLTGDDLERVMGRAVCDWLGWDLPSQP